MTQRSVCCLLLLLFAGQLPAQNACTNPGQTPSTAIPICNSNPIHQPKVTACRNSSILVPGCSNQNTSYNDNNPIYYKFTCYAAGTLGFVITPDNINDDNDWQLFDITGHNPNDIFLFSDTSIIVTGNWSGNTGLTGTSASGVNYIQCRSDPFFTQTPTFSVMPVLQLQHEYILLIAHSDILQGGFTVSFGGGTANITNTTLPELNSINPVCNGNQLTVKLNKKVKCSSIAANGSDFTLSPASATIISATAAQCNSNAETDSVVITCSNPIPPGNYSLIAGTGSDGNTLIDYCGNSIGSGSQLSFSISAYAQIDSVLPLNCSPDKIILALNQPILCSSIAADGSDFLINGSVPATIIKATGTCNNNFSTRIELSLSKPITQAGNFSISLKNGSDGNSLMNECGLASPAGLAISFATKDTVNADFAFTIYPGCVNDTISFAHDGRNLVNSWQWSFENSSSVLQNPTTVFNSSGNKHIQLIVSNGMCSDTISKTVVLKEKLKADFTGPDIICPENTAVFTDKSSNASNWFWDFSNGNTSNLQQPLPQQFIASNSEKTYLISLTAGDGNCSTTVSHTIKVLSSCFVAVPSAFTPNNDQLNDFLYPLNIFQATQFEFKVYNRLGLLVFSTTDISQKWDGTYKEIKQPVGMYAWQLSYKQNQSAQKISLKGTTLLIR